MKKFATEYVKDGKLFGDAIEAENILEAIAIAKFNEKGETVLGEMIHEEDFSEGGYPGSIIPWDIIDSCGAGSK